MTLVVRCCGRRLLVVRPSDAGAEASAALPARLAAWHSAHWLRGEGQDLTLLRNMHEAAYGFDTPDPAGRLKPQLLGETVERALASGLLLAIPFDQGSVEPERKSAAVAPPRLIDDLSRLLSSRVYPLLLSTSGYTKILERSGLRPPFAAHAKPNAPPLPPSFRETWRVYAKLISAHLLEENSLEEATLKVELLRGPVTLYRLFSRADFDPEYPGDWWFDEVLWRTIDKEVREVLSAQAANPLLSELDEARAYRAKLRSKLAISIDWNQGLAIRKFTLPAGAELPVITGIGRAMPAYSANMLEQVKSIGGKTIYVPGGISIGSPHQKFASVKASGGAKQVWVPWVPAGISVVLVRSLPLAVTAS